MLEYLQRGVPPRLLDAINLADSVDTALLTNVAKASDFPLDRLLAARDPAGNASGAPYATDGIAALFLSRIRMKLSDQGLGIRSHAELQDVRFTSGVITTLASLCSHEVCTRKESTDAAGKTTPALYATLPGSFDVPSMQRAIGTHFGERNSEVRPLDTFFNSGLVLADDLRRTVDHLQTIHKENNPTSAANPSLPAAQCPLAVATDDKVVHATKHTPSSLDNAPADFLLPYFDPSAPPQGRPDALRALPKNPQQSLTILVDNDRRSKFSWYVSLNDTCEIPHQSAAAYHFLVAGKQGALARQFLSAAPDPSRPETIFTDDILHASLQHYFGLPSSAACAQLEKGNKYVYRPTTGECVILDEFALSPVPALSNTDSLTKSRHDACATAMAKILVDSGHANVLEDPHTRNAFMRAVPANRLHAARHFQSATHGGSDAPSSRAGLHKRPDY